MASQRRNCFISYHHNSDYKYLKQLRTKLGGRTFSDYGFNDENLEESSKRHIAKKIQFRIWASSITIVLVGEETGNSDWVDWEIWYSLREIIHLKTPRRKFKPKGILAIFLPVKNHNIPKRLQQNLDSNYAKKIYWDDIENSFDKLITETYENRKNIEKIKNSESTLKINPQKNKVVEYFNKIFNFSYKFNFI